jgi:hypothetical protein
VQKTDLPGLFHAPRETNPAQWAVMFSERMMMNPQGGPRGAFRRAGKKVFP